MNLQFEQTVAIPRDRLFAFHQDPENLRRLIGESKTMRLSEHEGNIEAGSKTVMAQRVMGVWLTMVFEHFVFESPMRFGERMVRGPFKTFEHIHEFESTEEDGTILRDRLVVRLKWFMGGELITRLIVGPMLRKAFADRHRNLEKLIADGVV